MHRVLAASMAVAFAVPALAASIVVNGSFEDPPVSTQFNILTAGSTAITGWTVTAPSANLGVDHLNATNLGSASWAFDGVQSVDMAGSPGRGGVIQTLTTVPNQQYTLSFALSSNNGPYADSLSVFWDGNLVTLASSPVFGTWTTLSFNVTASSASTVLWFVGNIDGFQGAVLDNVSVEAVPAPAAAAVSLLGFATLGRRRRTLRA